MSNGARTNFRSPKIFDAFFIFGLFGAVSVLLDADHIIVLVQKELPITANNLITQAGRPLHIFVLVCCGIILLYSLALVYRLRHRSL